MFVIYLTFSCDAPPKRRTCILSGLSPAKPAKAKHHTTLSRTLCSVLFSCQKAWWRGQDLNLRSSGYEPDEIPTSPPRVTETVFSIWHDFVKWCGHENAGDVARLRGFEAQTLGEVVNAPQIVHDSGQFWGSSCSFKDHQHRALDGLSKFCFKEGKPPT